MLVIAGSGIGNILLATPIMRSLRRGYPDARIDVLVPPGRGGILDGNPDIDNIIEVCRKQGFRAGLNFTRRLWRRYDLALNARAQDRSMLNAWLSGRRRVSHVNTTAGWAVWPKLLLHDCIEKDFKTHALIDGLRLLDAVGVAKCYDVVPPECHADAEPSLEALLPAALLGQPYAVMHPYPRNLYKCWTIAGWRQAIRYVNRTGLPVLITGAQQPEELAYIESILSIDPPLQVINLAGRLSLPQLSKLLGGSSLFLGPDTGVTHLAAARGIPVVALFGPTDPVYWGPWPAGYHGDKPPFDGTGSQRVRNVFLVQSELDCAGCGKEGCHDNPREASRCMLALKPEAVLAALHEILVSSGSIQGDA